MTATRNWKCFIGMHQWDIFDRQKIEAYRPGEVRPYRIYTVYHQKCVHCGKLKVMQLG
ncbi:hypothetical protein CPT_Solent_014 [Salmonella phage Solent]|uniref:Uncharacterized protein n=1 Tax=Salmonella phage 9NA TaxID=1113547 RepID=A0A060DAI4_9CAUD|nr:hypothetical protein ST9NA_07 [Salmonella phage 9NA]AIB07010.1 hypothetical protein 9NA_07 [Salmonella phage 9NA]APU92851.1 hypothetical protein CPTSergei_14 [Salmonella phage vB_SenS_Sergei]AXY86182.1 hypothetical protein CPT_Solent_014 [Salmonella phage Solent]